jgi:hypothetical protein
MRMSPAAAGKGVGWAVLIALLGLCVSVLSGSKAGGIAAGKVEARVSANASALIRHENDIERGAQDMSHLRVEFAKEVSILQTDVKYIRHSMDEMKATQHDFANDMKAALLRMHP